LMQDRICRIDENLLHRTAGPYIRARLGRIFEIADNEKPPAGSFSIQTR